jgi:hypothetical protein
MQFQVVAHDPFAVLTTIVTPAIQTNVSSVLALGTGNRLGRVADRTRVVAGAVASFPDAVEGHAEVLCGFKLFAASALVSVAGSMAAYYGQSFLFRAGAGLAIFTGATAVAGLSAGCTLMVRETQLAVGSLTKRRKSGSSSKRSNP